MSWYRRCQKPGGVFFFTVVTYDRRQILTVPKPREFLRKAIELTQAERPFELLAIVLLSEHLHCVWRLPPEDEDFSTRWRLIKTRFTRAFLQWQGNAPDRNVSRRKQEEHTIWQRRFWEHCIRDETDLKRHVDYIHYNPVKHGYVEQTANWPYSTFDKFLALGEYEPDWGQAEPESIRQLNVPGD